MRRAKSLHDQGLWEDLAILVLEIGHGVDLGYYYLGRSAEGLGETSAASMYYKLALAERYKCEGWFDNCLGLNVPTLSEQRLRSLGIEPQSVGLQEKPVSANQNNSVTASNHQRPKDRIIKGPKIEETTPATDTVRSYERLGDSAQPAAAPKTNIRLNSSPRSVARPQGVFGLIWGESIAAVRKKGVSLTGDRADGRFRIFTAKSLPKNISISENYLLVFDRDNGLQKIVVISINIFNDVYGFEGKEKYADLKAGLVSKYGQPVSQLESTGWKLWGEADEFYQCLAYEGCGRYAAIFRTNEGASVVLELKGAGRGTGFLKLTYEGPRWGEAVDTHKVGNSRKDTDAL